MNALQRRDIRAMLSFRTLSSVGDQIAMVSLGIHYASTSQKWMIGVLALANATPPVVLSPVVGITLDRVGLRRLLGVVGLLQAVVALALTQVTNSAGVVALVALLGCGLAFTQAGYTAYMTSIVPPEGQAALQGNNQALGALAFMVGPSLAGLLYGTLGLSGAFLVDALSFAGIGAVTFLLHHDRQPEPHAAREKGAVLAGLRFLFHDDLLRPVLIQTMLFIFALEMVSVVEAVLITHDMKASATAFGFVMACLGAGNLVGALIAGRFDGDDVTMIRRVLIGCFVIGAGELAVGFLPTVTLAFPIMFITGLGNGVANVAATTLLARRIPAEVRGRAFAATTATFTSAAIASLGVGAIVVSFFSARTIFQAAGGASVLVAATLGPIALRSARRASHGEVRDSAQPDDVTS
jgi:MFS family permease